MTDAEYEAQRERVKPLFEKWAHALGLAWWSLTLEYEREEDAAPVRGTEFHTGKWGRAMSTNVDWRYARGTITAYMPMVKTLSDEELERTVVHELCHVFLNETRTADKADWLDHEERVAETLAKAFLWLRDSVREEVAKPDTAQEDSNA